MPTQDMYQYIRSNLDTVDWYHISRHEILTMDFIHEFRNYVDWMMISRKQKLSESFIRQFQEDVYWEYIMCYQTLSEGFIEEFEDDLNDWRCLLRHQIISESFIMKYKDDILNSRHVSWSDIMTRKRHVSELLIRTFQSKLNTSDWNNVSLNQRLSTAFIQEFKDKINIEHVKKHHAILISQFVANYLHNTKLKIIKQFDLPSHCIACIASYI